MGLSIAKQIIDRLGENIFVESEVGKGTSFHFTLKKYVSNAIALGPSSATVIHEPDSTLDGSNEHSSQDAPYEIIAKTPHDKRPKRRG